MLRILQQVVLFFLLVSPASCKKSEKGVFNVENYPVTKEIAVDSSAYVPKMIAEYKKGLHKTMSKKVGYSAMYMPIDKPQSLLSNMVADFTYELGKSYCKKHKLPYTVDGAIINIRGLRKGLPKGDVTLGDIYEISPFENTLLIVGMYGKDLLRLFDHITRNDGEGVGNIQLIANKQTKKLQKAYINGKAIEPNKLYHIISIDYLINGGDGMVAFSKRTESVNMNLKSRDALLQYVQREYKAQRPLHSKLDKRISYE